MKFISLNRTFRWSSRYY